jgi:hypothetical protein
MHGTTVETIKRNRLKLYPRKKKTKAGRKRESSRLIKQAGMTLPALEKD